MSGLNLAKSQWEHERRLLAEFLASNDDCARVIGYPELAEVAGLDVQHERRNVLDDARRLCEHDAGKVYLCVRNEGLRLASDADLVHASENEIRRANRRAKRAFALAAGVKDVDSMDADAKADLNTVLAQSSAAQKVSSTTARKKIRDKIVVQGQLPSAKVLDLFK